MLRIILIGCVLALAGCAGEKTRSLALASRNFQTQSGTAIEAISALRAAEIAIPPVPEDEARREFLADAMSLVTALGEADVARLVRPYDVDDKAARRAREADAAQMLEAHAAFAGIFDTVERAGPFGRKPARQSIAVLDKLIAQLAAQGQAIAVNPPRLQGRRGAMLAEVNQLVAAGLVPEVKSARFLDWRRRWLALEAEEAALQKSTLAQVVGAANAGLALRESIRAYDEVSVGDIFAMIDKTLAFGAAASGEDLTQLSAKAEAIRARIQSDPSFEAAARALVNRVAAGGVAAPDED